MKTSITQISFDTFEGAALQQRTLIVDRPRGSANAGIFICQSSVDVENPEWSINRRQGDETAARRIAVPMLPYAVAAEKAYAAVAQLGMAVVNTARRHMNAANLHDTHKVEIVLSVSPTVEHGRQVVLVGIYITPNS